MTDRHDSKAGHTSLILQKRKKVPIRFRRTNAHRARNGTLQCSAEPSSGVTDIMAHGGTSAKGTSGWTHCGENRAEVPRSIGESLDKNQHPVRVTTADADENQSMPFLSVQRQRPTSAIDIWSKYKHAFQICLLLSRQGQLLTRPVN